MISDGGITHVLYLEFVNDSFSGMINEFLIVHCKRGVTDYSKKSSICFLVLRMDQIISWLDQT